MPILSYITKNLQGPVTSNSLYHKLLKNTIFFFINLIYNKNGDKMTINFKYFDKDYSIDLNNNVIFFGQDSNFKNSFFNYLKECLINQKNNILINGNKINSNDYNIIYIDEESDFNNEFKFSKTNTLKNMIYDEAIKKINGEKLIDYTNKIFDVIDEKVNNLLDRKINKNFTNNVNFEIEIPDINTIIDKFTNIYIDNILINSKDISKSLKRKLLYQLYFLDIKNNNDKNNIIIIKNFDVYLNSNEIINLLNTINKLSNENCHFIISSSSNIFEYISLEKFNVYKITNRIIPLNRIKEAIKINILKKEYFGEVDFETYYNENENLLSYDEINLINQKLLNLYPIFIGKILNANEIDITLNKPKNIICDYIVCKNEEEKELFIEIFKQFID